MKEDERSVGMTVKPKIIFFITEDWYFWSHRLPLARAARDAGFEVVVATRIHQHGGLIAREGFKLIPLGLRRRSRNVIRELLGILEIIQLYRRERPDIVHHVAVKPVLYGSWAARIAGVRGVVNALAGLGFLSVARGWKARVLRRLVDCAYRSAFSSKNTIGIFQNPEDMGLFVDAGIVTRGRAVLIRGAGVDVSQFKDHGEPAGTPTIVMASRMLWNKGVGEFVEAARRLGKEGIDFRAVLAGDPDPENPASIPEETLRGWHAEGVVEWWGQRTDMPEVFANCHIACLPSYYGEGLPKALLEAAACARAIVTTDIPGCREIVKDGYNGILVPTKDVRALAQGLKQLILSPELRSEMGRHGREMAVSEFSVERVVQETLTVYREMISP